MKKNASKEDVLATIEEASKDEESGLKIHVEVHKMRENDEKFKRMASLIRSVRVFKKRVTKSVNQDIRNMMNSRVN